METWPGVRGSFLGPSGHPWHLAAPRCAPPAALSDQDGDEQLYHVLVPMPSGSIFCGAHTWEKDRDRARLQ